VTTRTITDTNLAGLAADLLSQGTRIIAPALAADGLVDYRWIERFEDALPGGALPRRSLKEFLLPPTEPLLAWKQSRDQVHLREVPVTFGPRVVIGARPCDAAALEVLDRVMNWDYRDELWFGRRGPPPSSRWLAPESTNHASARRSAWPRTPARGLTCC